MTLESIEELRKAFDACTTKAGIKPDEFDTVWITKSRAVQYLDEIEAEIAERYMKLPVDADGVPIHVGDEMMQDGEKIGTVTAVGYHGEPRAWVLPYKKNVSISYFAIGITHYKPRTLEDVLDDLMADDEWASEKDYQTIKSDLIEKYAAEIRELLGLVE